MEIKLGRVAIRHIDGDLQTTLPSGAVVHAIAHATAEYAATAARLGYADTERLNRDHDLTHSLLARWLGLACSPTLAGVADGAAATELTDAEEDAVLAIQRFANLAGLDLAEIAARAGRNCGRKATETPFTF